MNNYNVNVLILLMVVNGFVAKTWYISNNGSKSSNCGDKKVPCKIFKDVFAYLADNDKVFIYARFYHELFDVCKGSNSSIKITKPVDINGYKNRPKLYCKFTNTFLLDGSTKDIKVNFTGITFSGDNFKQHPLNKCKHDQEGIIHVDNVNLYLKQCYFQNLCTAISLEFTKDYTISIFIRDSYFERVSFSIRSDNIRKARISVISTTFVGNTQTYDTISYAISLRSTEHLQFTIKYCFFRHFNEGLSFTVKSGKYTVLIDSNYFSNIEGQVIIAKFTDFVIDAKSTFIVSNGTFINNRGFFSSALHIVKYNKHTLRINVHIDKCLFLNNEGLALFGTIYANGIILTITDAYFANNVAGEQHGTIQGFGGAIYVETDTTVNVVNTTFVNNTSTGFGGAIFSRGSFSCINCTFYGASTATFRPLLGDILYATAGLTLVNTSWRSNAMDESKNKPLIWHPGSPTVEDWHIVVSGFFDVVCPVGHNISQSGVIRNETDITKRLTLSCKPCPRNQYSLASGAINITQEGGVIRLSEKRVAYCHHCKYGGVCNHGSIRPRGNYYGFRTGDHGSEVRFMSCPTGYCCSGDECKRYDSCQIHRTGLLCGQCKQGLSENLINSNCISPTQCDDIWWILPIYMLCGIIYIICFMYLDYISAFVKSQLLWWQQQLPFHQDLTEYEEINQDGTTNSVDNEEKSLDCAVPNSKQTAIGGVDVCKSSERFQSNTGKDEENITVFDRHGTRYIEPEVFTDFVSLSFYFFQMFLLIRMRESIVLEYLMTELRSIYASIFTLSIEANNNPFIFCPIPNLNAVSKMLLIKSFSFYLLGLLFLFHGVVYIIQITKEEWNNQALIHFSIRLKVATIRILQLAYATLSTTILTLVSCVQISNRYVLLIDGSIQCFRWWQMMIFVIIIGWVAPFPITLVQSLVHLKNNVITYHQFILAWIFPLPYLIWCIYRSIKLRNASHDSVDAAGIPMLDDEALGGSEMDQSIFEILYRMESPFKGTANHLTLTENHYYIDIPEPAFWSGVLIGRRLILILVFSFIQAPVLRLYLALVICVAYLVHHLYYQPYLNASSNVVETISSSTLVVFCSMNLFFAYSYVSDISPEDADATITILFRWFEAVVLVILPTVVILILVGLVLTRAIILCFKAGRFSYSKC